MDKKLYRDEYHRVFGGVCSGLAEYFNMDVTIVRLIFVFGVFFLAGSGLVAYAILWVVVPKKGFMFNNFNNPGVDYRVPPEQPAAEGEPAPPPANPYGHNPFASGNYGSFENKPFENKPFENKPFENKPFENRPFENKPFENTPFAPKQPSHAGIIVGVVLIALGGLILVNNYDLIPNIDFGDLWPVVLVIAGLAILVSGQAKHRWEKNINANNQNQTNNNATAADETSEEV